MSGSKEKKKEKEEENEEEGEREEEEEGQEEREEEEEEDKRKEGLSEAVVRDGVTAQQQRSSLVAAVGKTEPRQPPRAACLYCAPDLYPKGLP